MFAQHVDNGRRRFQRLAQGGTARGLAALAAAVVMLVITGCTKPTQLTVGLDYRPTDQLDLGPSAGMLSPNTKVYVAPVMDNRTDKTAIGQNIEDEARHVPILAGQPDPATFLRDALKQDLTRAGVTVVDDESQANRVLKVELMRFWSEESNVYRTEILAHVAVDSGGRTLWQGNINGANEKFGRSLEVENYQEAFSDSAVKLAESLLGNPGFQAALK